MDVTCVHVRERHPANAHKRLEWCLLTTADVRGFEDAIEVVKNYKRRWRVEEFHRAWKTGVCKVEDSQLRTAGNFRRWATIGAAVAVRAERLKTSSRSAPDADATTELSRTELDAAIILSRTKKYEIGDDLTLAEAVDLIARIGGYTGKSSGGPPGTQVIRRGLERVAPAATAIAAIKSD